MYDNGGETRHDNLAGTSDAAERLLRRIDEVTREISAARDERAAEATRAARMRLAAAHRAKRLLQRIQDADRGTPVG